MLLLARRWLLSASPAEPWERLTPKPAASCDVMLLARSATIGGTCSGSGHSVRGVEDVMHAEVLIQGAGQPSRRL